MSNLLPGSEAVLAQGVLGVLGDAGTGGRTGDEIARALDAEERRDVVDRVLAELRRSGEAIDRDGRWRLARFVEGAVGEIDLLSGGDALVRTGRGGEPGFFVPARSLGGAVDADTVLVRPRRKRGKGRGRLPEAEVVEVLERKNRRLVGTLELDEDRRWLIPFDPKIRLEVEVTGGEELLEEQFVVVEVESFGGGRSAPARGRVVEVLGSPETPGVDVLVVLRHFGIPEHFPPQVLAVASQVPPDPGPDDWHDREDLREATVVTIDGASARDFDDAISVAPLGEGGFRLGVHIADVSHVVAEGSAFDLEAYRRGTSVYYPERAIPMLPETVSNGLCSLRPDVPRLTLSAILDIAPDGTILRRRFAETVIRSNRRLTYDEVRRLLEEPNQGDPARYGEVLTLLRHAEQLMEILNRSRTARGSIDFDLPEGDVVLDTDGVMVGVRPGQRHVAHRIIEEFMIAANEAVAFELESHECPALYRVHDAPDPTDLEELRTVLRSLGIALKGDLASLHPSALQKVLARVAGRSEEPFVSTLVLRAMQRALYSPECRGHYALASRHYTHFTSPIRRYPDLLVHRRLKALLAGAGESRADAANLVARLPAIAEHASSTERRAEQSERDLLQWKKVRFLADRVGDHFAGRVTGVQPFGLFVQLEEYFVDGLVPIRLLADDFYVHEPEAHRLVGQRAGRVFQLGDAVEVVLVGVDSRHRGLDLKIVGMPEPKPRSDRRGRGPRR